MVIWINLRAKITCRFGQVLPLYAAKVVSNVGSCSRSFFRVLAVRRRHYPSSTLFLPCSCVIGSRQNNDDRAIRRRYGSQTGSADTDPRKNLRIDTYLLPDLGHDSPGHCLGISAISKINRR